jgi:hypothetical protein
MAQKTIDYVLSLGVFKKKEIETPRARTGADLTREAIAEIERGEYLVFDTYEDYLKYVSENV